MMERRTIRYSVVITRVEEVKFTGRDFKKTADSGNQEDDGPIYGYVEFPDIKTEDHVVLRQELPASQWGDTKLAAVLSALNDLGGQNA